MRDVLRRYKPDRIEDLTALNALYRPGPMSMIDDFIERKWGRRKVEFMLPEMEKLLTETLGVMVYQEQVMQIANEVASYSLGEADLLRRAMGKKDPVEMAKQRDRFQSGAAALGHPKAIAAEIFDHMEKFAGYGFNKSHSAAYALLAYQTAYLKTHYPVEFMAALLTSEISKPENVVKYIQECREMDISVEPPDVQLSGAHFTPSGDAIRFGLTAIKNVGGNAIESILTVRRELEEKGSGFTNFWEFCEKVDLRLLEQARPRVSDQGRCLRLHGFARQALRSRRQSHRTRPESPERRRARPARPLRPLQRSPRQRPQQQRSPYGC